MPPRKSYALFRDQEDTITILNGQTASPTFDLHGMVFIGLLFPAAFDGTEVSFQSSKTKDGTFRDIFNQDGIQFTIPIKLDSYVSWDIIDFYGHRFVRLVSDVAETADRTFDLTFASK